ncbi:MAG: DUF2293 domain-containing protein [Verrucomicrobia bacterium]|nr:DUF2293 domain-containing protein [Verrucomicrobiota bacterium]|tara:strand:+ start:26156 stop:26833 length:678 start_codon:yes stop_codon:yes gene_type:complete
MANEETMDVKVGQRPGYFVTFDGKEMKLPNGWAVLPPGDAGLTRRVKKAGPHWVVKDLYKKRWISKGVLALRETINSLGAELDAEREDPAYAKKLEAGRKRRAVAEETYAEDFAGAVRAFLGFHKRYAEMAGKLASMIAVHATPVGSGTVARTKRIPIERRAEAATIAWLRHQTTSYDHMQIARIKGERRDVRRALADESRRRLAGYRKGVEMGGGCPVWRAVNC